MANTIVLAKNYVPLLDEVYKRESVTADLTGDPAMARAGANAAEIVYPQIAVTGLGDEQEFIDGIPAQRRRGK